MKRVKEQINWNTNMTQGFNNYQGTTVILDTGISKHPDLEDNIKKFVDLRNGRSNLYDDNGHGTHVAGCLAGTGRMSHGDYCGIAPGIPIIAIKILDEQGDGNVSHLLEGLAWVNEHREEYNIRAVNISIGMNTDQKTKDVYSAITLMNYLWDEGIILVCAAGNLGPAVGSLSGLGLDDKVITVGCHEGGYFGNRKGLCEYYSGRGYGNGNQVKPDLVAPGTKIYSCNYKYTEGNRREPVYVAKTGTSMSAPIVTGAAILLSMRYPDWTNDMIKERLIKNTRYVSASMLEQGHGMINLEKLLQ